jgi:hypothetical protein
MKTVYRVVYFDMESTEDSYKDGEIGPGLLVLNEPGTRSYDSLQALFDDMCEKHYLPTDKDSWSMLEDGRLDCQFMVDVNNYRVTEKTDSQLFADWKAGTAKLWSAYFTIYIKKAVEEDLPEAEVRAFGIKD